MIEAVIPYLTMPEKTLTDLPVIGPIKLQVFGPLVAVGVILGMRQSLKYAKAKDIDEYFVRDMIFWTLVAAFVISHWVSVLFYFPDQVKENPWVLLTIWNGLSSVGGFFGAFIGLTWYLRKHKQPFMPYGDLLIYGLTFGWMFGRLGCALVHDHPGKVVDESFLLAVGPWPDGQYRYDLGLYEFLFISTLTPILYFVIDWKNKKPGWIIGLVATLYAPFRFVIDFMRAEEPSRIISEPDLRYAGLTTAQWFTFAIFAVGVWLLFFRKQRDSDADYYKDSERIAKEKEAENKAAADDDDDDEAEAEAEEPEEPERRDQAD